VLRNVAWKSSDVLSEFTKQSPELSICSGFKLRERGNLFGEPRG